MVGSVGGVFAGIGGLESGFKAAGFESKFLCENDQDATVVLEERFPGTCIFGDVYNVQKLPSVDVLVAGFPCQDLSAVGSRAGIHGKKSSAVFRLFDLLRCASSKPDWIVIENVMFMLHLSKGAAANAIVTELEEMGYEWAYRVVDTRAFGLPQRRRRVFFVATRTEQDPGTVLFDTDFEPQVVDDDGECPCGFYWTEGNTGVGWAVNSIPTLKGGSALSIPSPPAIWRRSTNEIFLPDIRDAERLQGFDENWTSVVAIDQPRKERRRWKLVGNAVSVPVAKWIAERISNSKKTGHFEQAEFPKKWPRAARGGRCGRFEVKVSEWPVETNQQPLESFLLYPGTPISKRAASGFYNRATKSSLRFATGFLEAIANAAHDA